MTSLFQIPIKFLDFKFNSFHDDIFHDDIFKKPTFSFSPLDTKLASFRQGNFKLRAFEERSSFLGGRRLRNGVLLVETERGRKRKNMVVLVKNNQGFGFNGGGGGRDDGATARLLGNIALAVGLTYLSMTGQLGWILDAIVSIWIFAVLIPIVGIGAFLWWAGRDIMQGTCPNCRNEFQVFKSTLNDDVQLCPFCGQPFSVVGNEFVKDFVKFSNQSTTFEQAFSKFTRSKKGNLRIYLFLISPYLFLYGDMYYCFSMVTEKDSGKAVVDVEAEIKDAD